MAPKVGQTIARWTRNSNRRRLAEELGRACAWIATGLVGTVGLGRAANGMVSLSIARPGWVPAAWVTQWTNPPPWASGLGWGLASLLVAGVLARAVVRYIGRRTTPAALARRLDNEHQTSDLLTTAIAVEDGTVQGGPGAGDIVQAQATATLGKLGGVVPPFRGPIGALATIGITAAVAASLPTSATTLAQLAESAAQATPTAHDVPPLPEQTLRTLEDHAKTLARLGHTPGLRDDVQDALATARRQLHSVRGNPSRALSSLSRAEHALRKLTEQARREGLFDSQRLGEMTAEELADQMIRAVERQQTDTAAAAAEEIAKRLEQADEDETQRFGNAIEKALREARDRRESERADDGSTARQSDTPSSRSPSGSNSAGQPDQDPTEQWRQEARELAQRLQRGESGRGRSDLERIAEQLKHSMGRDSVEGSAERALSDIRRARSEQLGRMNGEQPGQGNPPPPGQGPPGPSQPGPGPGQPPSDHPLNDDAAPNMGVPFGPSGGKPGPGGGSGSDRRGDPKDLPQSSMHQPQRVGTPSQGTPSGAISSIRRFANGYRDSSEYQEVHETYSAVAEAAIRREQIPLTRREYIRHYFQAVRGQQ